MSQGPLFADARGLWWPVAFSRDLGRDLGSRPLSVVLAKSALALFRDREGKAHALLDRCPHRGVKLSLGLVGEDGCLECPYHGWRFAGDGACKLVPFNPTAKRERLGATALPTVEGGGLIWVFADESAGKEDPRVQAGPTIPEWLERRDLRRREVEFVWRCHWTRLVENMLDVPHLPFVHRRSIGRSLGASVDRPINQHLIEHDDGFTLYWDARGGLDLEDPQARAGLPFLSWIRPCTSVLELSGPQGSYRQHLMSVPGAEGETRLLLVSTRRFKLAVDLWLRPFFDRYETRVVHEDQLTVESSDPVIVPPAGDERSVASDEATLRFRKWYGQRTG
ncbi:MAG: aromatic ring-hydroxylating dioxygenase subunit alpha [Myxococcales bacterium]|nr:aromatic ring-hydroxylating dioxygenase subunit alpha [Myxococcales bacterium]